MNAIAQNHHTTAALASLMRQSQQLIAERGAHPSRTVILLPFKQLLPLAHDAWARLSPNGFAPRIETSMTWCMSDGFVAAAQGFTGDVGADLLTARHLLEQAGMGERADLLAGHVVEAARQLAELAAAVPPTERSTWLQRTRPLVAGGMQSDALGLELAVASIALEWVGTSTFPGDVLLEGPLAEQVELLVIVEGLLPDALTEAIAGRLGEHRAARLPLHTEAPTGDIALHQARDPSDEAERAAACVLRHVEAGHVPVALAAIDRVLTRRVRAMLEQRGAALRDETGWKLSTTRAGAHVMLALRACAWSASSDAVMDWLKNSPEVSRGAALALERRVRRAGIREWRAVRPDEFSDAQKALCQKIAGWREQMQPVRALPSWLAQVRELLRNTGQWDWLERDPAGANVLDALRLRERDQPEVEAMAHAQRRMSLATFTQWVNDTLEAASFIPPACDEEQVVVLPLHRMLGRPFAAVVLAGCDEQRLPAAPEPQGFWSGAQRVALGLPSREALEAEMRALWRHVLQSPLSDVLWRHGDDSGEPVLPSPLVQALQYEGAGHVGSDARVDREVAVTPTIKPAAVGASLPLDQISATSYEDLRRCPYRYFGLRQLALQEPDEIDQTLDKRDFGNWLHQVLRSFHEELSRRGGASADERRQLLDAKADEVTRELHLDEGEFLPFRSAWPQVREGYLDWLARHEAQEGAVFQQAESAHEMGLGTIKLVGRIDRIDRLRDGSAMVMDYKTEARGKTDKRVSAPGEDTQLAFYAALLPDDTLRAAYVNVGERGETRLVEQTDVVQARDLLVHGIIHDLGRIAAGEAMPALGEGQVCEYCAARGLCRRDFWS